VINKKPETHVDIEEVLEEVERIMDTEEQPTSDKLKGIHGKLGPFVREGKLTEPQLLRVYKILALVNRAQKNFWGAARASKQVVLIHKARLDGLPEFQWTQEFIAQCAKEANEANQKNNPRLAIKLLGRAARMTNIIQ